MKRRAAGGGKATKKVVRKRVKPRHAAKTARRRGYSTAELQKLLAEAVERELATSEVLKIISHSPDQLQTVFDTILEKATRICEAKVGNLFLYENGAFRTVGLYGVTPELSRSRAQQPMLRPADNVPLARAATTKRVLHIADLAGEPAYIERDPAIVSVVELGGARTIVLVPMLHEHKVVGVITIYRQEVRPFTDKQIALVQNFAAQAVIAIQNVRLFDEIQDKSRQLAEASQHKSQFLANMSHELRTPLNAILGYTELIADGIYGMPPEKMQAALKRVESNGKHLLGLINAVLDLSKIEAGELVLDLADYSFENVAHTVFSAVEPLAADKKLTFKAEVARDLPLGRGDERRLTQVLLNLVGNAIKFTDAGEVVIKASASNGSFDLSVRDTGPGISAADQTNLFQEFKQADNSLTRKKGGTGLGLAISKRIVEMHGGRIWVESVVGQGSTFACAIPLRVEQQIKLE
jgi:signal transduction histidine kinase